jgi:hypothetical protein
MNFAEQIKNIAKGAVVGFPSGFAPQRVPEVASYERREANHANIMEPPQIFEPKPSWQPPVAPQPEPDMERIKLKAKYKTEMFFAAGKTMGYTVRQLVAKMAVHKTDEKLLAKLKAGDTTLDKTTVEEALERRKRRDEILADADSKSIDELKSIFMEVQVHKGIRQWREGKFKEPSEFEMIFAVFQAFGLNTITKNTDVISAYIAR